MKNSKNIIGWFLLFLGLLIIFWALFASYNLFTGKSEPHDFFESEKDVSSFISGEELMISGEGMKMEIDKLMEDQLKNILPFNDFSLILNLMIWSILAGIFIFGGAQISGIGIKLIKIKKEINN